MRSRRLLLTAFAAVAIGIIPMVTATTTVAAPTKPSDPCSVVSTERVGAWVCVDPVVTAATSRKHDAAVRANPPTTSVSTVTTTKVAPGTVQQAVPNAVAASSGDGVTGWCSTVGCWYLYRGDTTTTTYHAAAYEATGYYGYGTTTIGSITFYNYDYLPNSTQVKMTNQHATADAARPYNVWWASNLLVNATYPSGSACGTAVQSASVPKNAGTTASYDGAYLTQCIYSTQATQHTFYWRDNNYPGRWYHYQKLAKFTHQLGYQSHYLGDWDTPQAPNNNAGWGWQNV